MEDLNDPNDSVFGIEENFPKSYYENDVLSTNETTTTE
jgi:hypothetical protein